LLETGEATDSLGTVECITTLFDEPRLHDDLLENHFSNLLHVDGEHVATLAYNFCSGDLLEWMRTRFFSSEPSFEAMFAQLPERPSRVLVLPHFAGSGTPRLDSQSKGLIAGLTLQTAATDILRGVIDSQNYEMKLNLEVWRRNGVTFDRLRTYGKGASADVALQIKADILGMAVQRLNVHETGCLGAALLAARGADRDLCFRDVLDRVTAVEKTFLPRHEFADQYDQAYGHYRELYPRLKEVLHGL
jgi:xylulokinase